jgi:hypothetical protein
MMLDLSSEKINVIAGLNRILKTLSRSLTMYLADSTPWVADDSARHLDTLRSIVADQRELAERLGRAIVARDGIVERAAFPTEFTNLNDLSLSYLMKLARENYLPRDIQTVERTIDLLERDQEATELGQRVLGALRAHTEMLRAFCPARGGSAAH